MPRRCHGTSVSRRVSPGKTDIFPDLSLVYDSDALFLNDARPATTPASASCTYEGTTEWMNAANTAARQRMPRWSRREQQHAARCYIEMPQNVVPFIKPRTFFYKCRRYHDA